MGRVIVTEFVSLDGVMEAPGGEPGYAHSGWTIPYHDPEQMKYKLDETQAAQVLLLGRKTYQGFAEAWPEHDDEAGFAQKMNTMPKFVVTTTLTDLEWQNSTVLPGPIQTSIPRLREEIDGEILVHGSRTLVHSLLRNGLIDELRLMIFPVILGSGARIFPDSPDAIALELVDHRRYASGVAVLTYHPR
ncbi:MAG: pyrimidine reductase [Acidimicrobiales bacterium]|nr:MAG: pyrimidine reductase [Acidimicrobiales bacterium]